MTDRPTVVHIQRKSREGANFSLEFIFNDVRARLHAAFNFKLLVMKRESNGIINRIINIFQVAFIEKSVMHVTGDIHYVTYLLPKKNTVLTILDCGFMNEANALKRKIFKWLWLDIPVKKSRYITTISEASKRDILNYTNCLPDKVFVIPVAVDEIFVPNKRPFNSACPVLLQIGTAPNKNIERLIQAISGIKCRLIIIGKISENLGSRLKDHNIDFENLVNISQSEMYQAYCNSDIVTFVSTFEGFGMPIIEANCVERPVIAGNNSSMPEVGGDSACYVDALSVEDIKSGIQRIINDESFRNQLIENGRQNRRRYSNNKIAQMYGDVYHRILKVN